ncbi:MAG TPA: CpsB/CapC family capsule biosynthesis tyrosine phosphatase [Thermoanaerobaculia bacterium]|nr:CpsB/CapC family capsule biosynthesis tyrosine phosphatase [Thermoanaerobaculia bacterium]
MIDIHHHCLPDVDDGPTEWDEAVAMCRMAADEGIETIVCTPHVLRGRWRTAPKAELEARIATLRDKVGATPRLLLGSEYFFAHDVAEVLRAGNTIVPLAGSKYVLMELASNNVPPMLDQPLYRMQLEGWIPIIAHPERNIVFQKKPELLASLIELGARFQVTAGSLTGDFGASAQRAAESWIASGMIHFVATDAHNVGKRPPRMKAAVEALRTLAGDHVAEALVRGNPRAVVENRRLEYEPEPALPRNDGFFTRLRAFFVQR